MRKYASRFIRSVGWFYISAPISLPILNAVIFDIPPGKVFLFLLSPLFYFLSALSMLAGFAIREMYRWSWYVFSLASVGILYGNAYVAAHYGETNHPLLAYILYTSVILIVLYRVTRELRVPYFLPKIRWWESNTRFRFFVPVLFSTGTDSIQNGEILDISLGGCFIKTQAPYLEDQHLKLTFQVGNHPFECEGTVVWKTESTVTHPKGIGVKFDTLPTDQRKLLKQATKGLKKKVQT